MFIFVSATWTPMTLGSAGTPHTISADSLQHVHGHDCSWAFGRIFGGAEERQQVGIKGSSSLLWLFRDTHTATWPWCATRQRCSCRIPAATEQTHLLITTQTHSASGITVYAPNELHCTNPLPNPPSSLLPITIQHCASLGSSFSLLWNGNISSIASPVMHRWSSAAEWLKREEREKK